MKLVLLRPPREFTRFRIQDGFLSDTTVKYIPSDTIYSLYLAKRYEEEPSLFKDPNKVEEIKDSEIPRITSAYPYIKENDNITFYLPFFFTKSLMENLSIEPYYIKKFLNKFRNPYTFIKSEYAKILLEKGDISVLFNEDTFFTPKTIKITRNKINRISTTTGEEGSLFTEEYVLCYQNKKEEVGFYFVIVEDCDEKIIDNFINKIKEFFEVRGIGADKSTSNSTFKVEVKKAPKELVNVINSFRKNNILLHTWPLLENYNSVFLRIRYLVIDGLYLYPIISDGSLVEDSNIGRSKQLIKIKRRFANALEYRIF